MVERYFSCAERFSTILNPPAPVCSMTGSVPADGIGGDDTDEGGESNYESDGVCGSRLM